VVINKDLLKREIERRRMLQNSEPPPAPAPTPAAPDSTNK
jgi:hypothetical protein